MDGLREGIMSRIGSIAATGAAAVQRVLDAARAQADSHSPSMEMAKIAKLMKGLRCPKCGEGGKRLFMAKEAEIVLASHRLAADAGRV